MKKFLRVSDNYWPVTEEDLNPFLTKPSRNFKPNETEYTEPSPLETPEINVLTQRVVEVQPVLVDDVLTQQWEVQEKYTVSAKKEEVLEEHRVFLATQAASTMRSLRDVKLSTSDYMGLSDNTMTAAWITYRQALRDVPGQSGFPSTIIWPDEP
tara:strand:+ start:208 stop:669 length:462 start_codon:yes stop_codon:yes gene_type:complete